MPADASSRDSVVNLTKPVSELNLRKDADESIADEENVPSSTTQQPDSRTDELGHECSDVDHEYEKRRLECKSADLHDNVKYRKGRKFLYLKSNGGGGGGGVCPKAVLPPPSPSPPLPPPSLSSLSSLATRTCAERKEYSSALAKFKDDSDEDRPRLSRQVSVIQRTPFPAPAYCASPPSSPSKRKLSTDSACELDDVLGAGSRDSCGATADQDGDKNDDAVGQATANVVVDVDDDVAAAGDDDIDNDDNDDDDGGCDDFDDDDARLDNVTSAAESRLKSDPESGSGDERRGDRSPPMARVALVAEPEQEAPIDYHIPKKPSSAEDDAKALAQRAKTLLRLAARHRPHIYIGDRKCPKGTHIVAAAAGHSRTSSTGGGCNGGGQSGQGAAGNRGSSGHDGYNGAGGGLNGYGGGYNGAGGLGGGAGGGGGGDRPGDGCHGGGCGAAANVVVPKCEFESSVSPLVALPPFEVTLKGGHFGGYHQAGCNNADLYASLPGDHHIGMEFDPSQDMHLGNLFPMNANDLLPKQLSMLQNLCGIPLKEEEESSINGYLTYDDNLISESINTNSVDSLSFSPQFLDHLPDNGDYYVKQVRRPN